jgi:hypothetical protein
MDEEHLGRGCDQRSPQYKFECGGAKKRGLCDGGGSCGGEIPHRVLGISVATWSGERRMGGGEGRSCHCRQQPAASAWRGPVLMSIQEVHVRGFLVLHTW